MKKAITFLLVLLLLAAIPFSLAGCKKNRNIVKYKPSKYTESIDLTKYTLVFSDDFDGELDRTVWGDTRQGTRRLGFWTKNLAFTDGDGHLILRTEERGSRWCSETRERQLPGYNDSLVRLKYDDCYPFGMVTGEFGDPSHLSTHTSDMIGYVILGRFDDLGSSFSHFMKHFDIPDEAAYFPTVEGDARAAYSAFYDVAMNLFNYYSFVADIKAATSTLPQSARIGANHPYAMNFGNGIAPSALSYRNVVARLYGFASETEFAGYANDLADMCAEYRLNSASSAARWASWTS